MKAITVFTSMLFLASCASQKYADLSSTELEAALIAATEKETVRVCDHVLPVAREMLQRDTSNLENQAIENYAEFECALEESRWRDAYEWMVQYENTIGGQIGAPGFKLAYVTEHYEDAVNRLEVMARDVDSNEIHNVDPEMFWNLFDKLSAEEDKAFQERAINTIVKSPHFESIDVYFRSSLATWKLRFDADSGTFEKSDRWVSALIPTKYLPLLSDKRFEAIWPALEDAVGTNFVDATSRYLDAVMEEYLRQKPGEEYAERVVNALIYTGSFQEAVEFVDTPSNEEFDNVTKEKAWALNRKTRALDALGRTDEATELFERLATIPVNDDNKRWLISFTINRASRLARIGRWEQALDAIEYAESFHGSAYAKMIIRTVKVCARVNLNLNASRLLDELYENRKDSYLNAAIAMRCSGDDDRAAAILLDALQDNSARSDALAALQSPEFTFYPYQSGYPHLHYLLNSNEDLRMAFEREARFVPERFIPLAH